MMLIEDFKKDINTHLKKCRRTQVNRQKPLKRKHKNPLRITGTHNQTGEGIEQNKPGSKNGSRNNKEITKGDKTRDRKCRKEIRNQM